jgi:Ca2+-binding EF-hand superfamily protein
MIRKPQTLSPFAVALLTAAATAIALPGNPAIAFTERQVEQVFDILDSNSTGQVDRAEYNENKVAAMFPQAKNGEVGIGELSYEDTQFNHAFFNAADTTHRGKLDGVDLIYALDFDRIDTDHKGYITINDLRRFMKSVGR